MTISTERIKELETKMFSYKKAMQLLIAGNMLTFKDVWDLVFEDEEEEFIKAIETSEEEFIKFIENENR